MNETTKQLQACITQYMDGAITYAEMINKMYNITSMVINEMQTDYLISILELRKMDDKI